MDDYNAVRLLKEVLSRELKDILVHEIMEDMVEEFKSKALPEVQKTVDKITLKSVENFRDAMRLRDEIVVHMEWIREKQ